MYDDYRSWRGRIRQQTPTPTPFDPEAIVTRLGENRNKPFCFGRIWTSGTGEGGVDRNLRYLYVSRMCSLLLTSARMCSLLLVHAQFCLYVLTSARMCSILINFCFVNSTTPILSEIAISTFRMNKTTRWQRLKRNGERRLAAANSQKSLPTHFDRHMILIYGSSRHERAEVLRKIPAQALLTFAIAYSATDWNSRYSGKHVFDCMVTWSAENTFRCESWVEIRLVNLQRSSLSASQDFSALLSGRP